MKKIVTFLLFFHSLVGFSQLSDNFNDGLFFNQQGKERAVNWIGDQSEFIVNEQLQLQLNSGKDKSPAQLRTQSTLVKNAEWEFSVKMSFNPTVSNYAKVYLISDNEDLSASLNGLFIRIGYSDKSISLIQSQSGKNNTTLIQGESKRLDLSSVSLNIKATLNYSGEFTLYSKLEGETDYKKEGNCTISDIPSGNWFGISCTFTVTRSTLFYFDDIHIRKLSDEEEPEEPEVPETNIPQYGDILFSEIMAHPASGKPEYVEFFNAGDKTYDLKDCVFYYDTKPYTLPEGKIAPKSYFILCKNSEIDSFDKSIAAYGVNSFPTLANTGKLLMLENTSGDLVSWFEYSNSMYGSTEKKNGGWSLECIDFSNVSNLADNWLASSDESGGTPGKANSIQGDNPDNNPLYIESILPLENQSVEVTFSKPMFYKNLLDKSYYNLEKFGYAISQLEANYPQCTKLTIQLASYPTVGEFFNITASGLTDLSGYSLGENNPILVGIGHPAGQSDILINEILFNPPTGGNEYVEIVNCSNKILDLRFMNITSRKPSDGSFNTAYPLTYLPEMFYPNEYLVITKQKELVTSFFSCNANAFFVEPGNMPSLANTSGCAVILNNQTNEIIDEFSYSESMHSVSSKKGVALERISLKKPTNEASNWTSASSLSGYGTPGAINSQHQNGTSIENINKNFISIDYSNVNNGEYLIRYQLNQTGYTCRLIIYDIIGRAVNQLLNNDVLQNQGTIYWNGKSQSGTTLNAGIYIVYMEIFNEKGNVHRLKQPVILK